MRELKFRDISFISGRYPEISDYILNGIKTGAEKKITAHINLRNYYYLMRDGKLRNSLMENGTLFFEGIGMKAGFLIKGKGVIPDINGTDLFPVLMDKLNSCRCSIFLLGSDDESSAGMASRIKEKYPGIEIRGVRNGYFGISEETEIINMINSGNPDMLVIAMGFPVQEKFALNHIGDLNVKSIWCTGGLFDFISGKKKRAPGFIRILRMEWLYRMIREPRRMLHRNTVAAFWSLFDIIIRRS